MRLWCVCVCVVCSALSDSIGLGPAPVWLVVQWSFARQCMHCLSHATCDLDSHHAVVLCESSGTVKYAEALFACCICTLLASTKNILGSWLVER